MKYEKGTVLCTRDGKQFSNGFVLKTDEDLVTVITDYGNIVVRTSEEIDALFTINENWLVSKKYEQPLPSVESRLEEQISKLKVVLNYLKNEQGGYLD